MASRNPNGRGSRFPGKTPTSHTLRPATKDKLAQLSKLVGWSESDFVEGLADTYADTYAQQLLAREQEGADATEDSGLAEVAGADRPG